MSSKVEFTTEAEVGIQTLWNGITNDKFTILGKAAPSLLQDFQVLEGDGGFGTIFYVTVGPAAPHIPPFKEKFVELDETEHSLSVQAIKGGFLELGFASYVVTIKLDYIGDDKTLVNTVITYDLEKDVEDGTAIVDGLTNMVSDCQKILSSALQEATV